MWELIKLVISHLGSQRLKISTECEDGLGYPVNQGQTGIYSETQNRNVIKQMKEKNDKSYKNGGIQ